MQSKNCIKIRSFEFISFYQEHEECVAINYGNKKKACFLLSSITELQDKKGWTAALVQQVQPPPTTGPTIPTTPSETPVTGAPTVGGCEDKFFKNQAFETDKSSLMGKPAKSQSPEDCLNMCKVS